jgi:hypothetical protein
MKSRQKLKSTKWVAVTALALLAGNPAVGAQGIGHGKTSAPSPRVPQESSAMAMLLESAPLAGAAAMRADAGPAGHQIIVSMPLQSGYASRSASPEFQQAEQAEQVKQQPRSLSVPPVEQDATLGFPAERQRERYWQPRAASAIPQGTRSGMYPGSRLRGPFEQTYPRPFPGGGQP